MSEIRLSVLGRGFCVKCQGAQNGVEEPDVTEVLKRDDLKVIAPRRAVVRQLG